MLHREIKKEIEISRKCGQGKWLWEEVSKQRPKRSEGAGWTSWGRTSKQRWWNWAGPCGTPGHESLPYQGRERMHHWLFGKDPDAEKDWRQEKGMTKDEMVRWHHWLNGHEFEQVPGDGEGQGSLVCCSPWGHKESDTTEQWNDECSLGTRSWFPCKGSVQFSHSVACCWEEELWPT